MMLQVSGTALESMIDIGIGSLKGKSKNNKRYFQEFIRLSILLGVVVTLVVESLQYLALQKNITLMLGVILTLINNRMTLSYFNRREMNRKLTLFSVHHYRHKLIKHVLPIRLDYDQKSIDVLFKIYDDIRTKTVING